MRYFIITVIFAIIAVKFSIGSPSDDGKAEKDLRERLKKKILAKRFLRQNKKSSVPDHLDHDVRMETLKSSVISSGIVRLSMDDATGAPVAYYNTGFYRNGNSDVRKRNKNLRSIYDTLSTTDILANLMPNRNPTKIALGSNNNKGSGFEKVDNGNNDDLQPSIRKELESLCLEPIKFLHSRNLLKILEKHKTDGKSADLLFENSNKKSVEREEKKNEKKEAKGKMVERDI